MVFFLLLPIIYTNIDAYVKHIKLALAPVICSYRGVREILQISLIIFICAALFPGILHAENPQSLPPLAFPVDCRLGTDCWTVNYVDTDPEEGSYKDFLCGRKTYDGHKGVDFGLRSRIEMEAGVDVLAASDGYVLRARDGESDSQKTEEQFEVIKEATRECGNGVLIDHGHGLNTFYCHLKLGSIAVKPGEKVKEGQKIAQIGQSGLSEFPHLHFTVIQDGKHIDPYTGLGMDQGCGKFKESLWKGGAQYEPYTLFDGGFSSGIPDFDAVKKGLPPVTTLPKNSDAFLYWIGFYHAREGDEIEMKIEGPGGFLFQERKIILEQNRKRPSFYYLGRKLKGRTLTPGTYIGTVKFKRDQFEPSIYRHSVVVE